jgi:single-strand DNA-binding protein
MLRGNFSRNNQASTGLVEESKNMAKSVNKVILLGNVGKDPEIRTTGGGTSVANFSLATSDRFQDPQGNWQDRTEWHNLVAFKRTAEIVRDYVKKGSKLYIEGKIQTRSWDDKETGAKKYRTEIIVNDLSLLSGRDDGGGPSRSSNAPSNMDQRQPAASDEYSQAAEISDDDIPF